MIGNKEMPIVRNAVFAVLLISVAAVPLLAQSNDAAVWYNNVTIGKTSQELGTIRAHSGRGFGLSVNRFWTEKFSTELSYQTSKSDARLDLAEGGRADLGHLELGAATLLAQLHMTRRRAIDAYMGVGVSHMSAGNLSSKELQSEGVPHIDIKDAWTWAANFGVNLNVMPRIAVSIDTRYIRYQPDSSAPGDAEPVRLKINPFYLSAGIRYRF